MLEGVGIVVLIIWRGRECAGTRARLFTWFSSSWVAGYFRSSRFTSRTMGMPPNPSSSAAFPRLAHAAARLRPLYHLEHHLYPAVPHHHWKTLSPVLMRILSVRSSPGSANHHFHQDRKAPASCSIQASRLAIALELPWAARGPPIFQTVSGIFPNSGRSLASETGLILKITFRTWRSIYRQANQKRLLLTPPFRPSLHELHDPPAIFQYVAVRMLLTARTACAGPGRAGPQPRHQPALCSGPFGINAAFSFAWPSLCLRWLVSHPW